MRKKLFAIVMSMTMVASFMPSLAFATVPHAHDYADTWTVIAVKDGDIIKTAAEATDYADTHCDADLYKAHVCACGEAYDAATAILLEAKGNHKWVSDSPATGENCVSTWKNEKCDKSGCSETRKVDVQSKENGQHTWSGTKQPYASATCTEGAKVAYKCEVCGEFDENSIQVTGNASGHKYPVVVKTAEGDYTFDGAPVASDTTNIDVVDATCLEDKHYVVTCSVCHEAPVEYVVAGTKENHSLTVLTTVQNKSCTQPELKAYYCATPGCTEHGPVFENAPAAHTLGAETVKAPTCTEEGKTTRTCSVCGTEVVTATTPALGHSFSTRRSEVTPATCTEDQVLAYKCTRSGCTEYSDPVSGEKATGHADVDTLAWAYVAPTCTEKACAVKVCNHTGCDVVLATRDLTDDDFKAGGIANGKALQPTGHVMVLSSVEDATCAKTGVKTYKCACGETQNEVIAKLPHTIVNDAAKAATSTKTGLTAGQHCSVCNEVIVAQKVTVAKAKAPTVKAGKKSLKVTASKVTGATKYQVAYKQSGKSWKYATASTKNAQTIKSLKSGKKYYVKVRTISGSVKGAWSSTKSVKVK